MKEKVCSVLFTNLVPGIIILLLDKFKYEYHKFEKENQSDHAWLEDISSEVNFDDRWSDITRHLPLKT